MTTCCFFPPTFYTHTHTHEDQIAAHRLLSLQAHGLIGSFNRWRGRTLRSSTPLRHQVASLRRHEIKEKTFTPVDQLLKSRLMQHEMLRLRSADQMRVRMTYFYSVFLAVLLSFHPPLSRPHPVSSQHLDTPNI